METALPFGLMAAAIGDIDGRDVLEDTVATPSPEDARASLFYRTLRWLEDLASESPVVLALDDLHWADRDSLAFLSFLCRRIGTMAVAVVATLRPWPAQAKHVGLDLAHAGHARVEHLRPLSEQGTWTFLAGRVSDSVPPDVVREACTASSGNPLLLEQLALALNQGDLSIRSTRVGLAPDAYLLRRFAGIPEEGLACARAASVLGNRFAPDLAVAVARLDEGQAELALEALSTSGLVRRVGVGNAEFTHPVFRQALYDDLPPFLGDELHTRAFGLLVDRGMEFEAAEHAVRGHLAGDAKAVGVLQRAGQAALRAGAVSTAVERLEAAVAFAGELVDPPLLLLFGEALLAAGFGEKAVGVYRQLLEMPSVGSTARAEALRMLGRALCIEGETVEGIRRLEQAAEMAGSDRPVAAVQAILDLSRAAWLTGGPVGALSATVRARHIAALADEALWRQADAAWRFVAFVSGDGDALLEAAAADSISTRDASVLRDLAWNWGTLRNSGRAAKYAERFTDAEAVFTGMFAWAERTGSPHAIASLAAHHADTLARRGRFAQALDLADRAVALADLAPMTAAFGHVAEASVLLHFGRLEESEASCQRAESAASSSGQWLPLLRVWHLRAVRHLHGGEIDEACRLYARLEAETARLGIGEPCLVPWARYAVTGYVAAGQAGDAERVLTWVDACAERLPCRWPRIAAHVGHAVLAEAGNDLDTAEARLRAALALHDDLDLPVERIETLLHCGRFLRRRGRVVEARDVLRQALELSEDIGAVWLARYAHQELEVAGGRRRNRRSPLNLTAQEQRVADLAAAGRSIREIAQTLSVSNRTIESHLTRVYGKLGIHSQRELMARGGSSPTDATATQA
jgi:DNA-binding CsgD family transcriptional regulator